MDYAFAVLLVVAGVASVIYAPRQHRRTVELMEESPGVSVRVVGFEKRIAETARYWVLVFESPDAPGTTEIEVSDEFRDRNSDASTVVLKPHPRSGKLRTSGRPDNRAGAFFIGGWMMVAVGITGLIVIPITT